MKCKKTILISLLISTLLVEASPLLILPAIAQEEIPREKTLILYIWSRASDPQFMNIYNPTHRGLSARWQMVLGADGALFAFDKRKMFFYCAESFEYNSDFSELTIRLRRGMRWSDGQPYTSADVKFTWEMLRDHPELTGGASIRKYGMTFETPDAYTLVCKINKTLTPPPQPRFHLAFSGIFGLGAAPKHIWEKLTNPLEFKFYPPVVAGPYMLIKTDVEEQVWKRINDWWGNTVFGQPAAEYVIFRYMSSEALISETVAHRLDSCYVPSASDYLVIKDKNPYVVSFFQNVPYADFDAPIRSVKINCGKYPWNNPIVRRALSYAINRTTVVQVAFDGANIVWNGYTTPCEEPYKSFVAQLPFRQKVDKPLAEKYELAKYDRKKAEEMLIGIGWSRGSDGVWVTENGTRVTMDFVTWAEAAEHVKWCSTVAEQWRVFGIDVNFRPTASAVLTNLDRLGQYDANWANWELSEDPYAQYDLLNSRWYQPIGTAQLAGWTGRWQDPYFDKLLYNMSRVPYDMNNHTCVKAYYDATEYLMQQTVFIPVVPSVMVFIYDTYYWTGWPSVTDNYCEVHYGHTCSFEIILHLKSTNRMPLGIVVDPLFGRITEATRNAYYGGIGVSVIILAGVGAIYWRRRRVTA